MAERTPLFERQRNVGLRLPVLYEDSVWLAGAIGVGLTVLLAYLLAHPHPTYEGGLFLQIVAEIQAHGYALPDRIPYYTDGGIPFAYPPLMFYVAAILVDVTGIDPVLLMLVMPGLVSTVALVPYYYVAKELLGSPRQAGLATLVFAAAPPVLQWHVSAGGLVRAPALLLTLTGVYAGIRLFRDGERRWLPVGAVLFGLVLLSHPMYATFYGMTYLLFYAAFDRSVRGLLGGAMVAGGGLALAAPWLALVASTHGPEVFLSASGAHEGLAGGTHRLMVQFVYPFLDPDPVTPFYVAAAAGTVYAVATRRFLLPAWLVAGSYLIGEQRFAFVAGAMVVAMLAWEAVVPGSLALTERLTGRIGRSRRRTVALAVVGLLVLSATAIGGAYAASAVDTEYQDSASQPQTVDEADRRAMTWLEGNTDPDAEIAAAGDAGEWLPYYSKRTNLVSPWGSEWTSDYYEQDRLFRHISTCGTEACLSRTLAEHEQNPDYVYLPTGDYTVRGKELQQDDVLLSTLLQSDDYRLVYANDGVMIFEVEEPPTATPTGPPTLDGAGTSRTVDDARATG